MLKKSALTLDTVYEVRSDRPLSNGIEKLSGTGGMFNLGGIIPHVTARDGYIAGDITFTLQPGDLCELVQGPKMKNRVNVVQIRSVTTGQKRSVFGCEFCAIFWSTHQHPKTKWDRNLYL